MEEKALVIISSSGVRWSESMSISVVEERAEMVRLDVDDDDAVGRRPRRTTWEAGGVHADATP